MDLLTQQRAILAVHIEGLIAFVDLAIQWIEDKAVGAEFFTGNTVFAYIIFVALLFIGELSIGFRAFKFNSGAYAEK